MELVILIGLQGSGKSTFYRQRLAATHSYVSRDQFRNSRNPVRRQEELIASALGAGRNVVVDNTNVGFAARAPVIQQAKRWAADVVGYFFEPDLRQSLARNRRRDQSERVPDVAIFATARRLIRPSMTEGFDELFSVKTTVDGGFLVAPLREDAPKLGEPSG